MTRISLFVLSGAAHSYLCIFRFLFAYVDRSPNCFRPQAVGGVGTLLQASSALEQQRGSLQRAASMSVTIQIGVSDEKSVRVPLAGGLASFLEEVRGAIEAEREVDSPRQFQLRSSDGSLLTDENFSHLTDGDSLELLVIQATRMPPLQLLSGPG